MSITVTRNIYNFILWKFCLGTAMIEPPFLWSLPSSLWQSAPSSVWEAFWEWLSHCPPPRKIMPWIWSTYCDQKRTSAQRMMVMGVISKKKKNKKKKKKKKKNMLDVTIILLSSGWHSVQINLPRWIQWWMSSPFSSRIPDHSLALGEPVRILGRILADLWCRWGWGSAKTRDHRLEAGFCFLRLCTSGLNQK